MQKILPDDAIVIPDNAKRVFQGNIFDVYQWPQAMFDGSTKTFEMLKRPDTVQIIVIRDGQMLMVNDEQPGRGVRLHLPGGRVDETDESWEFAARRELREETGLVCSTWKPIDVHQPVSKVEWFVATFLALDITDELEQQLDVDGEKITPLWLPFDEVRQRVLTGEEPTLQFLVSFFNTVDSLETLMALPTFHGKSVDR